MERHGSSAKTLLRRSKLKAGKLGTKLERPLHRRQKGCGGTQCWRGWDHSEKDYIHALQRATPCRTERGLLCKARRREWVCAATTGGYKVPQRAAGPHQGHGAPEVNFPELTTRYLVASSQGKERKGIWALEAVAGGECTVSFSNSARTAGEAAGKAAHSRSGDPPWPPGKGPWLWLCLSGEGRAPARVERRSSACLTIRHENEASLGCWDPKISRWLEAFLLDV